jgi:glutamate--cysteine ligase
MTAPTRILTLQSARDLIRECSFREATTNRVGIELEWFTTPSEDPPDVASLHALLDPLALPCGSTITFEPGGQVELSSAVFDTCGDAAIAIAADSAYVRRALAASGIATFAAGSDPDRTLDLRTDAPRYVAMRRYFDRYGVSGGRMMCASAAIHLNIDAGDDEEGRRRWRAAHAIGPVLAAAFANSPLVDGAPSGWKSSREAAWQRIDPTRTAAVAANGDPAAAWCEYALDANVMLIRMGERCVPLDDDMSFRGWIEHGHDLGFPESDDLAYHLTTLFPPIRPRCYLELRMIDMLPDPWWRAAVAIATALVCDPVAREGAEAACAPAAGMWELAARCGMEDPVLASAARESFALALDALARAGCDAESARAAREYVQRFTMRDRSLADEQLDRSIPTIAEAI